MAQAKKELGGAETPAPVSKPAAAPIIKEKAKEPVIQKKEKKTEDSSAEPKLFVSGRLNRKDCNYVARSLHISESLLNDINAHCKGSESAIYNYLLTEGLKKIKDASGMIHVDIKEMEGEGGS